MKIMIHTFILLIIFSATQAADLVREINLRGEWHFQPGDDPDYADPTYDDRDWELIRVPDSWEDRGFPGYDGYAWYRTRFELPPEMNEQTLILNLGAIDDVDMVYVNGHFVGGTGTFPPDYASAWNVQRHYHLLPEYLKFGQQNVIAVRVYDEEGLGGIVSGHIGIYSDRRIRLLKNLTGLWKFKIGDQDAWKKPGLIDDDWEEMIVPGKWTAQGYPEYDGYGWYRKQVIFDRHLAGQELVLVLGKIDDIDEVYFNGKKIGSTGRFPGERYLDRDNSFWNRERFYYIEPELIRWNQPNTIAVRVYDVWLEGGIYDGPVGIATREEYEAYRRDRRHSARFKGESVGFIEFMETLSEILEDLFDN